MKLIACFLLALTLATTLLSQVALAEVHLKIKHKTPEGKLLYSGYYYRKELAGSVGQLKDALIKEYVAPRETLHVIWEGKDLEDNFDLSECHGASIDNLYLVYDLYIITVVKSDGGHLYFAVEQGDTIASLKDKIVKRADIPRDQQRLMSKSQDLDDSQRLAEFVVMNGEHREISLVLKPDQVRVRLTSGELITFEFDPSAQVASLKDKIYLEKGIVQERQGLYFKGSELANENILAGYGLSGSSPLTLTLIERAPIQNLQLIYVKSETNRLLQFEVPLTDTVAILKSKISLAEGIPEDRQHLYVAFQELADNKQLGDCVPQGYELVVDLILCPSSGSSSGKHVHVVSQRNREEIFELVDGDSVASLKTKIRQEKNMPQYQQLHVLFESKELADDTPLVEHVKENGPKLHLVAPKNGGPEVINVKFPSGRLISFGIAPTTSVKMLKEDIQSEKGILVDKQQLFFGGQELADEKRLDEYNIVSGSTLSLILLHDT